MLLTWDFLLNYDYLIPLPKEVRTTDMLIDYNNWKENTIIKNNIEINDYLHNKYVLNRNYCIEMNPFPYNVDKNIFHYVLWINNKYRNTVTNKEIVDIITDKMIKLNYNGYICFENHIDCKSVNKILHYQVFFRKC